MQALQLGYIGNDDLKKNIKDILEKKREVILLTFQTMLMKYLSLIN
jgi:hypothetical protein